MNLALSESLGQELRFAKKNQLNRNYETQVMIKKFEYESEQISKFQKFDVTGSLDRWKQDEAIGASFI